MSMMYIYAREYAASRPNRDKKLCVHVFFMSHSVSGTFKVNSYPQCIVHVSPCTAFLPQATQTTAVCGLGCGNMCE